MPNNHHYVGAKQLNYYELLHTIFYKRKCIDQVNEIKQFIIVKSLMTSRQTDTEIQTHSVQQMRTHADKLD
jgi:hypothetical protein